MPVDEVVKGLARQGLRQFRRSRTAAKAITFDDYVKGLPHVTQQNLKASEISRNGHLLPENVQVMRDEWAKDKSRGMDFLDEYDEGIQDDNWHNFRGHLSKASQDQKIDADTSRLQNGKNVELEAQADPDDLTPFGPWALKKSGEGVVVPEIDDSLSRTLLSANNQKDVVRGLRTPLFNQLAEHNIEITPEEMVSSGLFDKFLKRLGLLEEQAAVTKGYKAEKDAFKEAGTPWKDRPYKRARKNFKSNNRALNDLASANLFTTTKDVFGINRPRLKKILPIFGEGKKEWHHTHFFNSQGGKAFLNKIAQDPMIAANLFLKLKKLEIQTSGTIKNLTLGDEVPHNAFHKMLRKKGFEAWYDPKKEMLRGGEADIGELLEAIAESVGRGETDINEMFDILDVFSEKMVPWLDKQTKEMVGPRFEDVPGFVKATDNYAKETDVTMGRVEKPTKSKAPQKVVPAPKKPPKRKK